MTIPLRLAILSVTFAAMLTSVGRADFFGDLQPKLISAQGEKAAPFKNEGTSPKYTAIYYSAHTGVLLVALLRQS